VLVDGVKVHEASGSAKDATNNTMELTAALEGLKYVAKDMKYNGADVVLISDSQLVLGFATGRWVCKKLHLALLANSLNKHFTELKATDRWERGHQGEPNNERCDELAKNARQSITGGKP